MIDFPILVLLLMFGFVLMTIVFRLFKLGHDKEESGGITGYPGRDNNYSGKKDEMD